MARRSPRGDDREILLAGFETARGWAGLLVSLATGAIIFTATFVENFVPEGEAIQSLRGVELLETSWIVLGISVIAGVLLLGSLAALLNRGTIASLDIYGRAIRWLAISQIVTFIAGGILLLVFFLKAI